MTLLHVEHRDHAKHIYSLGVIIIGVIIIGFVIIGVVIITSNGVIIIEEPSIYYSTIPVAPVVSNSPLKFKFYRQ